MSKSEARKHFGSLHIYWHGPNHCWDATPGRNRQVRKNQSNLDRLVQRGRRHSDWRQAMSKMRPDDEPVQTPGLQAPGVQVADAVATVNWQDRWIEVAQVVPRVAAEPRPASAAASAAAAAEPESGGMPHIVVVLAFFAFLMIFATIEILFRSDEKQR